MTALVYRRMNATWDTTTNPIIANHWYKEGEIVEVLDNGKVINTWVPSQVCPKSILERF